MDRKAGQKSMPNKRNAVIVFTDDMIAKLDAETARQTVPNRSELVRQAVGEFLTRRQTEAVKAA